ncbi:Putative S-adenosyl-L-methionine-dependent methyltransferase [Mycobacterium talmoniae]|uniref:S-adenosyl-L-methionine-dependent methyltransferase n=1 Tax=Mycobacterium talmoniae TaxID=1858794 RepID=A0A2S8BMK9_9MYCO|nr:Putative S-adenosyl-L-methionine-dependent methyltransferase [Mycobacterium talmoniae]
MSNQLAAGFGATAMMVAAARVNATASGLVNDPFAEPLFRAAGGSRDVEPADSGPDGTTDLFAVGTKFFDDFLGDAGRSGIRQVVILASGLDTRAYRLWWPGGTTVYELDKPRAIEFKTQTMRGLGATPTAHRRAVGVDLGHDWPAALRQAGFDAAEPTVWDRRGAAGHPDSAGAGPAAGRGDRAERPGRPVGRRLRGGATSSATCRPTAGRR